MATAKYTNLASGTLTVGVNTTDTALVLDTGEGAAFPSAGDFWVVLAESTTREICLCTSRSTDTLTVTRNQGGTNASFTTAATVTHVITSQMIDQVRSDQVQTGALASRPSVEKDGILYLPSDGLHLFRDTGAAWGAWGPIWKFTPPVDGDFAWINEGTATKATGNGYITLSDTDAGGDSIRLRYKSTPATPFSVTIAWIAAGAGGGTGSYTAGLAVRQSSDGKIIASGAGYITSNNVASSQDFNSATSFAANNYVINGGGASFFGPVRWLRYSDNGTNRTWAVSADGITWVTALTEGRTTFLTADQIGFFLNAWDGNAAITLLHWAEA